VIRLEVSKIFASERETD